MKKLLSLSLSISMSALANAVDVENYIAKWGQLEIVGNQLSSQYGEPIQLKGWSTFSLHYGEVQGCLEKKHWSLMHEYGANVVRLSMHVSDYNSYLSNPSYWKSTVKKYIDEIAAEGMYCILDWHLSSVYGQDGDPNSYTKEAMAFFAEISEYCMKKSYNHVLYEICNEPACEWEDIKKYARDVIPVIFKNQPNAMIIVDTDKWSQNIMNPVVDPLIEFKNNVLYSFHYYAGSDYHRLGDFRNAQKFIPVIASEWSATRFDRSGPINEAYSDAFLEECSDYNGAPQLVSWCYWNWGKKLESASTFVGECIESNLSKSPMYSGEYIVNAMKSEYKKDCKNCGAFEVQKIPNSVANAWRWEQFDFGGEGYAYHDKNSSAYVIDRYGEYIDYAIGDESDAFSWAYTNGLLDKPNPYYKVEDGNVTAYSDKVQCSTADNKISYKSLNGGKTYCGVAGSGRPDEGVDLLSASLKGTELENKGYNNLGFIENGEWINYTVDVAEPGYYKVQAYVDGEISSDMELAFFQKNGNIVRSARDLSNMTPRKLHFERGTCADPSVTEATPWDCWSFVEAFDEGGADAILEFVESGVQSLGVSFLGDQSFGIGPLVFTKVADLPKLEFTVSPNPTYGSFTVTLAEEANAKVNVKDASGRNVFSSNITKSLVIDKKLPAGNYTVVVTYANGAVATDKLEIKEEIVTENYIAKWGQLELVDNQLSSESGEPIQLKGWSTFSLHYGEVQGCLGKNNWSLMHKYGANVVRLSMYVNELSSYYLTYPERWKKVVKEYIDELAAEGMYCIVDWHLISMNGLDGDPNSYTKDAKDFFGEISEYCKENSYKHVLYEICNEPTCEWADVKKYAEDVIPVILKNQPNAMIIVGTDNWSQNIMNPVTDPLDEYKKNVLYSFHYYAASDYHKLGEFRNAQKFIPVLVSEWSSVKFDGDGPINEAYSDAFLEECSDYNGAPQLVSWCFWNWGKKNEPSSTFTGTCSEENLSKSPMYTGEYIVKAMTSEYKKNCKNCGPYEVQSIPNTAAEPWRWENFDFGGEGYAYHDKNSSAYQMGPGGEIVGYSLSGDESDAFSWAYTNGLLDKPNPYYKVVDGSVTAYSDKVQCSTADNKISYKSLNGGKTYCGVAGSGRPDEGVDLLSASLKGTELENKGYNNLGFIEDGEWINYTVNVAKPGYYKVQAYVSGNHTVNSGIAFYQKNGNIIRPIDDLTDNTICELYFNSAKECADINVSRTESPWDCWSLETAMIDRRTEAVLEFKEAGIQELGVRFIGYESLEIGPLVFTNMNEIALEFTVSPNPTYGSFTVSLAESANAKVVVKNADGKVVYSDKITKSLIVDKDLAPGTYSVEVISEFGAVSSKELVVKEKLEDHIAKWGQLELVDNQLSSESGEPIQLKGWSTFSLHYGEVQGCLGKNNWSLMHQLGANVVRLAMYVNEYNSYLSNPALWKSTVKRYIDEIASEGMYCVLDWHLSSINGQDGDPNSYTKDAKDFFGEISEYCMGKSYKHVLYEICNEPACEWADVKKYAEDVIPVILKNQPNAMIIVGTDNWSQNIMNPVTDPLDEYKKNVLYSFHYYAASDYHKLGEFRNAQKFIPVLVSEWSSAKFDGDGPINEAYSDAFLEECSDYNGAPQLVSWCYWNWGRKREASSTFVGDCMLAYLSKSPEYSGEYIVKAITSDYQKVCRDCEPYEVQKIPNTEKTPFRWENFDFGGEGYAYHDKNSSAYQMGPGGEIVGYSLSGDESDAFSWAYTNGLLDKPNPYYKVVDGSVTAYSDKVQCSTADNNISYKSLNGGKTYCGVAGSGRPDEGVDLLSASLKGTELENKGYINLGFIEDGEWINYTVDVKEPGYYKLQAYVSGNHTVNSGIAFYQKNGNIVRSADNLSDKTQRKLHFIPGVCADPSVTEPTHWDCWSFVDALDEDGNKAVLEFTESGVQTLGVRFLGGESLGVGPLVFTNMKDIENDYSEVVDINSLGFYVRPNPTSGAFTVALTEAGQAQLEVINVAGQVVYSAEIESSATINKALASGVYSVVVKSNGGVNTQKLVVK